MEFPDVVHFGALFTLFFQSQSDGPIIVDITEPPKSELSALSQVLLGSLGLTGVLALMAILLGIGIGGLMFWIKRRRSESS
jgi:hypothetical protein